MCQSDGRQKLVSQVGENRVGKLYAVSPLKEFRLVVTAEDIPATITPSKQEILTTEVFTID
jgi:hypothetical protein